MIISISGDILLSSVRDHYTTLHYKTLAGFVWVNRYSFLSGISVKLRVRSILGIFSSPYHSITQRDIFDMSLTLK